MDPRASRGSRPVDGHFCLFWCNPSTLPAGYGEAERLGLFLAGREEIFFSEEGAEGGDTNSPPVGDAAGEGDVGGFGGADRSTEGNKMFDHVAVGAHAHLVAAVADGDGGGSGFFCFGEKEGGVSDHVIEDFAAHAVVVAVDGFTGAF